ncbi:hypothetical protein D9M71_708720 [compost metagenome]
MSSCSPRCWALGRNTWTELAISSGSLNGMFSSSSEPRSMREKSRMSLITLSRCSVDSVARAVYSLCSLFCSVVSSSCSMPSTPFIGVRSSWLIIARKSDLARLAFSASSRAPTSWAMLRCCSVCACSRAAARWLMWRARSPISPPSVSGSLVW